jgi:proline iminopeptidase
MSESFVAVPGGRVWCSRSGEGSAGATLLCLHGGPGAPSHYLEPLRRLSRDRPVVLYDQLGCGRSDRPAGSEHYRAERFVEELATVRETLGIDRFHLLGHSWGGALAVMYSLTRPHGMQSLVLASPLIDADRWTADCNTMKAELPEDVRRTIEDHEKHGFTGCFEYAAANLEWWRRHVCRLRPFPEEIERMLHGFGQACFESMWGPSEFSCTGTLKQLQLSPKLDQITVPTLFTCGRHDEATPDSTGHFSKLVSDSQLRVFDNSSHMAHIEESDAYLDCLTDFLRDRDD